MIIAKILVALLGLSLMYSATSQDHAQPNPKDTEAWGPEPRRVAPGSPAVAPSDAVVLFDGKDLREWVSAASPARRPIG